MEKIIETRNLKKVYGEYGPSPKVAINDVSMDIFLNDFLCIMGPSGSGKTTLINILSTIDQATNGSLIILGKDMTYELEKHRAKIRKQDIGFIFQNYNLLDSLRNKDNILFSLRLNNCPLEQQKQQLNSIAQKLGIEDILEKYPFECSGGQQQRVAIARTLVSRPKILFADEPTGNIDSLNARELMELFVKINKEFQTTIIMVTHDSLIASYSKDFYYLKDGKINERIIRGNMGQEEYYSRIVKVTSGLELGNKN